MKQKGILEELARRLGISESETLRMALMDYAKEIKLVEERMQSRNFKITPFLTTKIVSIIQKIF